MLSNTDIDQLQFEKGEEIIPDKTQLQKEESIKDKKEKKEKKEKKHKKHKKSKKHKKEKKKSKD